MTPLWVPQSAEADPVAGSALTTHAALTTGAHGGIVASGDSRLTDTRTPTDASVTLAKLANAIKPSGSAAAGDEAVRALGTSASTACAGNDSRLSDTRKPSYFNPSLKRINRYVSCTLDAAAVSLAAQVLTDGQLWLCHMPTPEVSLTVAAAHLRMQTQGNYNANNENRIGLYELSGSTMTLRASSADDGTLWKAANNAIIAAAMQVSYPTVATLDSLTSNGAWTQQGESGWKQKRICSNEGCHHPTEQTAR